MKYKKLTSYLERSVLAPCHPRGVACHAPVYPRITLLAPVHHAQEEQRARWQEHAMRGGRGTHRVTVLVPLYGRGGDAVSLAVEGGRLVPRHREVHGVLRHPGCAVLLPCNITESRLLNIKKV